MPNPAMTDTELAHGIEQLLQAAARTMAEVVYCWVVTAAGGGYANARVVKVFPNDDNEDLWTRWFLTKRDGRKSAEIRAAGRVTLAYQHRSGDAYVTLAGPAEVVDEASAVEPRLQRVDDPDGRLVGNLVAVKVTADHLELHVRGVTAEPWGHGRTLLQRSAAGAWRLVPDSHSAAHPVDPAASGLGVGPSPSCL